MIQGWKTVLDAFNAQVSRNRDKWYSSLGKYDVEKINIFRYAI